MGANRAHIAMPVDLIKEIDALVGPRGRSAFITETARAELRKRRLLAFFAREKPAWKDEDHPEWPNGDSDAWVRSQREGWGEREEQIANHAAETEAPED